MSTGASSTMNMNPTDSEIVYRKRKLRTVLTRLDINNDGYMSAEDFEMMAKKINELSNATGEQAESCHKAFVYAAKLLGYIPGVKTLREDAVNNMNEQMLTVPLEEQREMCDATQRHIFDAVDTDGDGYISLEEFKKYYHVLGPGTADEDKVKTFNLLDANHNGKISKKEFLEATFEYLHGVKETELSKVFFGPLV